MTVKCRKSRKYHVLLLLVIIFLILQFGRKVGLDENSIKRSSVEKDVERRLAEALVEDKGKGCQIPKMDPFDEEIMKFNDDLPKIVCGGFDWVRCHLSKCAVRNEILSDYEDIVCKYRDIIFITDHRSYFGPTITVRGDEIYELVKSDHVKVSCTGTIKSGINRNLPLTWTGYVLGYRTGNFATTDKRLQSDEVNILIVGFDSTSKNGFIRRMPKSHKVLTEDIGAVIMNGYNILGDGTPAALFPILTGLTELELPDRRKAVSSDYLDDFPFIFKKLHEMGYRTAYYEDSPQIGTFQYRFNGFKVQPADHYLRHFFIHTRKQILNCEEDENAKYCVGDTPFYLLMLNATEEFMQLPSKKFIFTFIVDISHDYFNRITTADEDFADWLLRLKTKGHLENTLLFVMSDHGSRFGKTRNTLVGKLEERLPLLAVRLPERLSRFRPDSTSALAYNAQVLTTAHDLHATILDVFNIDESWVNKDRGHSLLRPISSTRSCSEAGIERHWCSCLKWTDVKSTEPIYSRVGDELVKFINTLTEPQRALCEPRTLKAIEYVQRHSPDEKVLKFSESDKDGYMGKFDANTTLQREEYGVKISVGPGHGIYEASMLYIKNADRFEIDSRSISRINAYNTEPHCISSMNPHLNMYCYCKDNP